MPLRAFAQPAKVLRVGWLSNDSPTNSPFFEAFRNGMRELGYVEGRNLVIEARFAAGSAERLDQLAVELVQINPQILVTQGGPATYPALRAKPSMPVVFGFSGDPVEGKIVQSFAHPGGNATGMSHMSFELVGKRMEMLKETMPGTKRVAIIANPHHPGEQGELRVSTAAAKSLGLAIDYHEVRNEVDLENAFAAIFKSHCDAIDAFPDAFTMRHSDKIAAFTIKTQDSGHIRLGAIRRARQPYELRPQSARRLPEARQLCGQNRPWRQARGSAGRIADQRRDGRQFENRESHRINVPNSILLRADRVIE